MTFNNDAQWIDGDNGAAFRRANKPVVRAEWFVVSISDCHSGGGTRRAGIEGWFAFVFAVNDDAAQDFAVDKWEEQTGYSRWNITCDCCGPDWWAYADSVSEEGVSKDTIRARMVAKHFKEFEV